MITWVTILFFLAGVGLNIGFGVWNMAIVRRRTKAGNTDQIEHFWWGVFYGAVCAVIFTCLAVFMDLWLWWMIGSLTFLHASVFPVSYNADAGLNWFNLSKTSKAWFDRNQVKLGLHSSALVNVSFFILSIGFLILQLITK